MRKTYRVPQIVCIVLAALLCLTLFMPMLSMDDDDRELLNEAKESIADVFKELDALGVNLSDSKLNKILDVDDLEDISYFELTMLYTNVFTEFEDFRGTETTIALVVLWLPLFFAVTILLFAALNKPVMVLVQSLLEAIFAAAFVLVVPEIDKSLSGSPYDIGMVWEYYIFAILTVLLILISFWYIGSKHSYKKKLLARKRRKAQAKAKAKAAARAR